MWIVIGALMCLLVFWIGLSFLRMMAQPVPAPPPEGEMRRVNRKYRCGVCGSQVKMTSAASEEPEPPRHCMEDMELVSSEGI